jgi:hypothetical protein
MICCGLMIMLLKTTLHHCESIWKYCESIIRKVTSMNLYCKCGNKIERKRKGDITSHRGEDVCQECRDEGLKERCRNHERTGITKNNKLEEMSRESKLNLLEGLW